VSITAFTIAIHVSVSVDTQFLSDCRDLFTEVSCKAAEGQIPVFQDPP
jgi:hypothetical protein